MDYSIRVLGKYIPKKNEHSESNIVLNQYIPQCVKIIGENQHEYNSIKNQENNLFIFNFISLVIFNELFMYLKKKNSIQIYQKHVRCFAFLTHLH